MVALGRAKGRIAFVTPRYGEAVVGGSESVIREAAHGLAERGYEIDLLPPVPKTTSLGRMCCHQARQWTAA